MAKKIRLIARLDVKNDHLVKGIQLEGLRKLGDPHDFAADYYRQGVDELLYMDIVASLYNRNNLSAIVRRTTDDVFIPITVGGGLRSVDDVRSILQMGADKAAINTAAIKDESIITQVAEAFGRLYSSFPGGRGRWAASAWCWASRRKNAGTARVMRLIMTTGGNTRARMSSSGHGAAWRWARARSCSPAWTKRDLNGAWTARSSVNCARPSACPSSFRVGAAARGTPRPPWP